MREVTVRIKFNKHCLGDIKVRDGSFVLPRSPAGAVTFLASWHRANAKLAAELLGKHQDEVDKILWDIIIDGDTSQQRWYRRYYGTGPKKRYFKHECFQPGQIIGINCAVPEAITDDDLWRLMQLAGQYKGLSPFHPGEFGFFSVESVQPRYRMLMSRPNNAGAAAENNCNR